MCALVAVSSVGSVKAEDLDRIPDLPADMMEHIYVYQAEVVSAYDADTVTVAVDLGFSLTFEMRLRLYGIDAWEVRGSERERGLIARDRLRELVADQELIFRSVRDGNRVTGKYGRYLAVLYLPNSAICTMVVSVSCDEPGFTNLNVLLVTEGHAEFVDY